MTHTLELNRTPQDYYQDGSGKYAYKGEFITFKIDTFVNEDLVKEIEAEVKKFEKLCKRNSGIYIQKEIKVDWATFRYCVMKYKTPVMRPNSCFYTTLEFSNRRGKLDIVSPTINFDYNIFTK